MSKKEKKTNKEQAEAKAKYRMSAVRTVMTMSLKRSYKVGVEHLAGLNEYEYIAGLLMAVVDVTISVLKFDRSIPKSMAIDMVIDLLKTLREIDYDE